MTKIDEVSEVLGRLDEKTDNLLSKVNCIEKHLREMNGTIVKHQNKMYQCDERFKNIETNVKDTKFDYKLYAVIASIVVLVNVILKFAGI